MSGTELRISVRTASQLPSDLSRIKSRLGFPLVKFEAPIFLEDLEVNHMLGTSSMYMDTLVKHYRTVSVLGLRFTCTTVHVYYLFMRMCTKV